MAKLRPFDFALFLEFHESVWYRILRYFRHRTVRRWCVAGPGNWSVGVLAADDEVGEAQVLAVDGVHDRLLGTAVVHPHVQPGEVDLIVQVLTLRLPQIDALVALADVTLVDEGLVGLHACVGRHVVALELPDERVQDHAGLLAGLAQDDLGAVDQCVLVGTVQRVARLEGDRL